MFLLIIIHKRNHNLYYKYVQIKKNNPDNRQRRNKSKINVTKFVRRGKKKKNMREEPKQNQNKKNTRLKDHNKCT